MSAVSGSPDKKKAPVAPAVPQVFRLELRLEAYDGDGEPFANCDFTIVESIKNGKVLFEGITTADGAVQADLPGSFEYGLLRLAGSVGYIEIPLRRWPLPPSPGSGSTSGGTASGGPDPDEIPEGIITPGAEAAGSGGSQPGQSAASPPPPVAQRGSPTDVDVELLWHEIGCRLSNLGYLNRPYSIRWPASGWERILVKTGVLNYCTRHDMDFPDACNWNSKEELNVKDPAVKALLDALMKEHGEKVP